MDKHTWAIEDIYKDVNSWEKDFNSLQGTSFSEYRGKFGNKHDFLACMKKNEEVSRKIEKLYVYAMMQRDSDTKNAKFDELVSKIERLSTSIAMESAFITTEISSLEDSVLLNYIADKDLKDYDYTLKRVIESKAHVLSEKEEQLLTGCQECFSSFKDIFSKIDNANLPLKPVEYKGKTYPLTHGTYSVYMRSDDREFRKKVFNEYYDVYISLIDTISATYIGNVKKNVFMAKAKNFGSVHEKALFGEDVNPVVYDNLIETVHGSLNLLHDYMSYRKKTLKLDKMEMYDIYVPIIENAEIELEYEKAYDLVEEGLSVLGKDYVSLLEKGRQERWIDVEEKEGKRFGAYSVATYDTHPYVLLNYQKTTHDVFTIAHEMGHSIHSYFSNKTQCYNKADYKIFVAEVASTVNEVLLCKYLISTAKDKKLKKYLLSYLLELIRTTLYRQTQFAEFEYIVHGKAFNGEPLSKDVLNEIYGKINDEYYGESIEKGGKIKYEWARVPHFYSAFYVYKYATGIISALAIAERIMTEGKSAIEDYFKFLSSGGSDSPIELLKIAGVDLTEKQPFISAFKVFSDTLNELKEFDK